MDAVHLDLRYGSAECWMEPVTYALDLHICGGRKPLELNSSHIPVTSYQLPGPKPKPNPKKNSYC